MDVVISLGVRIEMHWPLFSIGTLQLNSSPETCCIRLAENTGRKKSPKIRHLGTIAQVCQAISLQLRHVSTIGKLVKQQYLPHMSHNIANFGPLTAEIGLPVWDTPANFKGFWVLPSLLHRRRSTEAKQTLHDVWPSPGLVHYIFGGSCPLTKFCHVQNSFCLQVLRSPILAALLHGTPAAGVSQTLRRGTMNEITELWQRAPPMFGWAAIALGIGSHSRCLYTTRRYLGAHEKTTRATVHRSLFAERLFTVMT